MRKLVFATNNKHKLEEARKILEGMVEILSLAEIECNDDIPETANTLEGNALIKARYIKEKYGYDCFADDTGLLVEALDGAPGVYSARYAGEECNPQKNMEKLLDELNGIEQRRAAFVTCVALTLRGGEHIFMGEIAGSKMTLDISCRNMMKHTGASIVDVFKFASLNPATCVGFFDRGEIAKGKRADLVFVDYRFDVKHVILGGNQIK